MDEIKAILFDLDGVLINTMNLHEKAFKLVLSGTGMSVDKKIIAGRTTKEIFYKELAMVSRGFTNKMIDQMVLKKQKLSSQMIQVASNSILTPGVKEVIPFLAKYYKLAICTSGNSKNVDLFYELSSLSQHFIKHLSQGDVSKGKPDPEIYLKAAEILGLKPSECIVVEDSFAGCCSATEGGFNLIILNSDLSPSYRDFPRSIQIERLDQLFKIKSLIG